MRKLLLALLPVIGMAGQCFAAVRNMPVHCEKDTVKIDSIIANLALIETNSGDRMVKAAEMLIGAGRDDYYTTDSIAALRINVDSFMPITFLNAVIALDKASQANASRRNWRAFADEFESLSCRRGENAGFPSIMFHSSDWIVDNVARGNITEFTENYSGVVDRMKSLDEMTRFRDRFAALHDSVTFEKVRMTEMGFRTHRVPALKKETIKKKDLVNDLQNGDIIILVPNRDGIDYYDIGIIEMENGLPYIIHLSPQTGQVVKEKDELSRYMSLMTKYFQGYRLVRVR